MRSFFGIFYVDNTYFASRNPVFLQVALNIMVKLFERVGLKTNRLKMQAMVCTSGRIRTQLPTALDHRMSLGFHTSDDWEARRVSCHHCGTKMQARSLPRHLATQHGVYQQTVVAEELLERCASVPYCAERHSNGKLTCPVGRCLGVTKDGWNMRQHFWDLQHWDTVTVPKEGRSFPQCGHCGMQVNPRFTGHWKTESCVIGTKRKTQRKAVIDSAITLCCNFKVHGEVLEKVEVFKYLGHLLAQDNGDIQAVGFKFKRLGVCGRALARCFTWKMQHHKSLPSFTRQWCSPCCYTAVKRGISPKLCSHSLKGSMFALPTRWRGSTNPARGCLVSGNTP